MRHCVSFSGRQGARDLPHQGIVSLWACVVSQARLDERGRATGDRGRPYVRVALQFSAVTGRAGRRAMTIALQNDRSAVWFGLCGYN